MRLSRYGFNMLVLIWLAPVLCLDIYGNTTTTGFESNVFYYKAVADAVLACVAAIFVFALPKLRGQTQTTEGEQDTIVGIKQIANYEYLYCGGLALYAAFSWFDLFLLNKQSTGFSSFVSFVWSLVSLAICLISAVQFFNLKGAVLKKKLAEMKEGMLEKIEHKPEQKADSHGSQF